jgi:hypothetical protein
MNHFDHRLWVLHDIQIRNAEDPKAVCFKASIPLSITFLPHSGKMLPTVNFDHELCCRAIKINNEISDGLLSVELNPRKLLSAQSAPKLLFAIRHVPAQGTSVTFQILAIAH